MLPLAVSEGYLRNWVLTKVALWGYNVSYTGKAVKRKVRFVKPVREPSKVRVGTDNALRKMALEPGCR